MPVHDKAQVGIDDAVDKAKALPCHNKVEIRAPHPFLPPVIYSALTSPRPAFPMSPHLR